MGFRPARCNVDAMPVAHPVVRCGMGRRRGSGGLGELLLEPMALLGSERVVSCHLGTFGRYPRESVERPADFDALRVTHVRGFLVPQRNGFQLDGGVVEGDREMLPHAVEHSLQNLGGMPGLETPVLDDHMG